ncbi:putative bifunctional diguanylate cyclase/phosphodiesterase [Sphingomonas oryzagri]
MGRPYGSAEWDPKRGPSGQHPESHNPAPGHVPEQSIEDIDAALASLDERHRYTIGLNPLILWIADATGAVLDVDARVTAGTGLSREECLGLDFLSHFHQGDRPGMRLAWLRAQSTDRLDFEARVRLPVGYRWHRVRGAPRRNEAGDIVRWYGSIEDVHERRLADDATRWAADHDDLTGLWNRRAFMRALRTALDGAQGSGVEIALLLIDLDHFKSLNDRFGHGTGDAFLKEVARRLDASGTGDAMPGRLGGDEFAVMIYTADREQLDLRIRQLQLALAAPVVFDGQAHGCRASIGVALYPGHGSDADGLYRNADLALYEAKNKGQGLCYFRGDMRAGLQARLSALSLARHALDNDDIVPFYQPKVDLHSGAVTGFEALLRWRQADHGYRSPVPEIFEDAELAIALGDRIFDRMAVDISEWLKGQVPFGRIALNISSAEFRREDFADRLLARIDESGIPASVLELEVTETVFLGRLPHKVTDIFGQLRASGLTIALDDFGMGYASLVHLKQFPVDVLKIDCAFIQSLDDPVNAAIVRAIVGLGEDLHITTVAEGVETVAQAEYLHEKGCKLGQGYLFSPAMPANEVPGFIASRRWRPRERRSGRDRRQR